MKNLKILMSLGLIVGSIMVLMSCRYDITIPPPAKPGVNAGIDQTITLPTSVATLTGIARYYDNQSSRNYVIVEWSLISQPVRSTNTIVKIVSRHTESTLVEGLDFPGLYGFRFTATDGYNRVAADTVTITVQPAVSQAPNTFTISPNVYKVTNTRKEDKNIIAESPRVANDSGSITFIFFNAGSIPSPGTTTDYKVVNVPAAADEVGVSVTHTVGNGGTQYDCTGTDNVKATVGNANGKISIKMPTAAAKQLGSPNTKMVSADINEQ